MERLLKAGEKVKMILEFDDQIITCHLCREKVPMRAATVVNRKYTGQTDYDKWEVSSWIIPKGWERLRERDLCPNCVEVVLKHEAEERGS
jgi:hypothetical protein